MVRVIMRKRGTGKTKQLISLINGAIDKEMGYVVCIERKQKLRYDVHYKARLVEAETYPFSGYDGLLAFVAGMYATNYDITHVFIDSLYKITGNDDPAQAEEFLRKIKKFSDENGVKFTVTISADESLATDGIREFFLTEPTECGQSAGGGVAQAAPL